MHSSEVWQRRLERWAYAAESSCLASWLAAGWCLLWFAGALLGWIILVFVVCLAAGWEPTADWPWALGFVSAGGVGVGKGVQAYLRIYRRLQVRRLRRRAE